MSIDPGPGGTLPGGDAGRTRQGWSAARRELGVAALLIAALAGAAWAADGPAAATLTLLACAALGLAALRGLIEPHTEPPWPPAAHDLGPSQTFLGFWRTRSELTDAMQSLSAWDRGLRPRLTNLLAARLSERHGISLADDPEAARILLAGQPEVWSWIDPRRQVPPDAASLPGIPPRALAALIDRLERL